MSEVETISIWWAMNSLSDVQLESVEKASIPNSYWIGEELDWEATFAPVKLHVELPYWLMVPDCVQDVEVNGHTFSVAVRDNYCELYVAEVADSKYTCFYLGPPQRLRPDVQEAIEKSKAPIMRRKCKTVLLIHSKCNEDVLVASREKDQRKRSAYLYLQSFCGAHLSIVNRLIQQYRLSTYDYFAYELSPWDIPIWFVKSGNDTVRISLQDYLTWDEKPVIVGGVSGRTKERYKLIDPSELQTASAAQPSAGEFELLDALNFMERGDYSDAVRRITTAIEVQTEFALRQELLKTPQKEDVERQLEDKKIGFWDQLDLYQKISGRELSDVLAKELHTTRDLRNSIVHRGKRIAFNERGQAQKSVDTGRWIFNWIENQPARRGLREKKIGMRSLGRHFSIYYSEITPSGVAVHKPHFGASEEVESTQESGIRDSQIVDANPDSIKSSTGRDLLDLLTQSQLKAMRIFDEEKAKKENTLSQKLQRNAGGLILGVLISALSVLVAWAMGRLGFK